MSQARNPSSVIPKFLPKILHICEPFSSFLSNASPSNALLSLESHKTQLDPTKSVVVAEENKRQAEKKPKKTDPPPPEERFDCQISQAYSTAHRAFLDRFSARWLTISAKDGREKKASSPRRYRSLHTTDPGERGCVAGVLKNTARKTKENPRHQGPVRRTIQHREKRNDHAIASTKPALETAEENSLRHHRSERRGMDGWMGGTAKNGTLPKGSSMEVPE